jgi:hypothetical protein
MTKPQTTTAAQITLGSIVTGMPARHLRMSFPRSVLIDGVDSGARVDADTKEMTPAVMRRCRAAIRARLARDAE